MTVSGSRLGIAFRVGLCAALAAACSAPDPGAPSRPGSMMNADGTEAGPFRLAIRVLSADVVAGGRLALHVVVPEGAARDVTWTVPAGRGAVDANNVYTAPIVFEEQIVELVARSVAHPDVRASVPIKILGAMPKLVSQGGAVLATPTFTAVSFAGDAMADTVESMVSKMGSSAYWAATTEEYGVAAATATAPVRLAESAPAAITDEGIQAWLAQKLDAPDSPLPAPVGGSVYVILYPQGTAIDLQGSRSCYNFSGYHGDAKTARGAVPYVVVPQCGANRDRLTKTIAHELVEAATDPLVYSAQGLIGVDDAHAAWNFAAGVEVADLCGLHASDVFVPKSADLPFVAQRSWSAVAAASGHDPCVPSASTFFAGFPILEDDVDVHVSPAPPPPWRADFHTKGAKIAVGETKTIDVVAYSDGPPAEIADFAFNPLFDADGKPYLEGKLEPHTARNGTRLKLTIKALRSDPSLGGSVFYITSLQKNGAARSIPGFVKN
jgi:hypothetical protein